MERDAELAKDHWREYASAVELACAIPDIRDRPLRLRSSKMCAVNLVVDPKRLRHRGKQMISRGTSQKEPYDVGNLCSGLGTR